VVECIRLWACEACIFWEERRLLKRGIAFLLCLVLLVGLVPMHAAAVTEEEKNEICAQLRSLYRRVQYTSGYWQLRGLCGLMTAYQLHLLGIDTEPIAYNGNEAYNVYCDLERSSGGFAVKAYPATDYTMEEALRTITHDGTRDAFNLLLGFSWTSTAAGAYYGHTNLVHTIQDGTVFFMEGFHSNFGGPAGTPIVCDFQGLVDFYGDWTMLEGIVEFGNKSYLDFCREIAADLFVQVRTAGQLLSLPVQAGTEGSVQLRQVTAGERLRVTAVYENTEGDYYYEVEDAGVVGYLAAETADMLRLNYEDVRLLEAEVPRELKSGYDFTVGGEIRSQHSLMTGMRISIKDESGSEVQSFQLDHDSRMYTLNRKALNKALRFQKLKDGRYTCQISVSVNNHYLSNGILCSENRHISLYNEEFTVGRVQQTASRTVPTTAETPVYDGWQYLGGTWYCFQKGEPRTGWYCDSGIDYYLRADGSAATGWVTINGKERLFTDTGAMRTGWVETEEGTFYLLRNGVKAVGWREVDGVMRCFDEAGHMCTDTWKTCGQAVYYLGAGGKPLTGWVKLPGGTYYFGEDGCLQGQVTEEDGKQIMKTYDPETGTMINPVILHTQTDPTE